VTKAEAERILESIETTCDDLIAELTGSVSAAVQSQCVGMTMLKEHLMKAMDFRGFASDEAQVDTAQLRGLVDKYCRGFCPSSRAGPPGHASPCQRCPIRYITLDPLLRQVHRAGETEPHA